MRFRISMILAAHLMHYAAAGQDKSLGVDYSTTLGSFKQIAHVNAGPDSAVRGYQQMRIRMVRVHDYYGPADYHAYTKGFYDPVAKTFNPAFNPQDTTSFDFSSTDVKVRHIVDNGFTPLVRLGISYPSSSNVPTVPPGDPAVDPYFRKFASIAAQTVRHYNKGWKNGFQYGIRYWEIWNEPNLTLFWSGANATALNYYRLYKSTVDSLKAIDPTLKVGGPGLAYLGIFRHQTPYYDSLISYCGRNGAPMDFYSWHLYDCMNPLAVKVYADTVRQVLDRYGFTNAESLITEINPMLQGDTSYNDKPKGAAYAASVLITAQDARLHGLYWYRGLQLGKLAQNDTLGAARLAWNGYAFRAYNDLLANAPVRLKTNGEEIVVTNLQSDTTNLMLMSGKSISGDTVEVLISNLRSAHTGFQLTFSNLPWPGAQTFGISHTRIQSGKPYVTEISTKSGTGSVTVGMSNIVYPSVHHVRLVRCAIPKPTITRDGSGDLVSSSTSGNQWYRDGIAIAGATGVSYKPVQAGNYTVQVSRDGCSSGFSDPFSFTPTSVLSFVDGQYLRVYPNPTRGDFFVEHRLNGIRSLGVSVHDLRGAQLMEQKGLRTGQSIDLKQLASGSYLLRFYREDGSFIAQSFIVRY